MLKYQIRIKLYIIFILLFLFGCAGNRQSTKQKPRKDLFSDSEIVTFLEGDDFIEIATEDERQNINRKRPPWATTEFLPGEYGKDHIARHGYDKIYNRRKADVADSLRNKLREQLGGDIKTSVEQETSDSVFSKIVIKGKKKSPIYKHITTTVSRHYSNVTFDGVYDKSDIWVDPQGDTLWYLITYNKTKYLKEEQQRIIREIKEAGEEAYKYLRTSFNALNQDSDMERALSFLGVASYYISKGGGSAIRDDLFNPGKSQDLLVQRHMLIKEIDKNIKIYPKKYRAGDEGSKDIIEGIATKNKPLNAKIYIQNDKNFDLNKVKLRIRADSNVLNFPQTVQLGTDNKKEITFFPKMDSYGKTVNITITFDVISNTIIPDKEWYLEEDYIELLEDLPKIKYRVITKEFEPLKTWAFIHSDIPKEFKNDDDNFQYKLEKVLGKYSDYFNIMPREKFRLDYERARLYKSDKINFDDLKYSEKKDIQNHDLDIMLKIDKESPGPYNNAHLYTLTLSATSPDVYEGGILSTDLTAVKSNDVSNKFKLLVDTFFKMYFQRKIQLNTPNLNENNNINFTLNSDKTRPKQLPNKSLEFSGVSRFEKQTLVAKIPGYRKQKFVIDGDAFSLLLNESSVSTIQMKELVPIEGTLTVTVFDSLTGRPIRSGGRGEGAPPVIKVRKWYGFFPNPFHSVVTDNSYQGTFKLNKLGKYYVKVTKQLYGTPFPKIVTVYDDEANQNKQLNNVRFTLEKQPIGPAIVKSVAVPGWGQWSLGKKRQGVSYFTGALISALWGGVQYYNYKREVNNYNQIKTNYLESDENWDKLENDLSLSRNKLISHRNQIYGSIMSFGIVWGFNVFTVTW